MPRRPAASPLLAFALASCTIPIEPDPSGPGDPADPSGCFDGPATAAGALFVNDPQVLMRFGFGRVMDRLRATAGTSAVQTNKQLYQSWMKTFGASPAPGDCDDPGLDPNGYVFTCPRTRELKLSTVDPFDPASGFTFAPVGLFSRFDLAPADGATCGEYRIAYGMRPGSPAVIGRALLIFEASLPNPSPALGARGCLPVAQFWQSLHDDDPATRADRLEAFYFTGDAVPGFPAVVDARHYGLADGPLGAHGAGQVRTNFFIEFAEWNLREFKLEKTCTGPLDCRLRFAHVPVADNPAPQLFTGTHARSGELRAAFLGAVEPLAQFRSGLGLGAQFDELESVSSRLDVQYRQWANIAFKNQIRDRLVALGSPAAGSGGPPLTADHILERATLQTCAGCHELSNFADLGGEFMPPSLGFVHIDEFGSPSPMLVARFLPERERGLVDFIRESCGGGARAARLPADARYTLGGSRVGAAN